MQLSSEAQINEPGLFAVPGYELIELIGVGGYGEVWKASAPDGTFKAVKRVYGRVDETRAARELKSLKRIINLHHPFLLSHEKIEIINGQLIVVTELADSTLQDRFQECRDSDLVGIPRDELLVYLQEAAEALDFLYQESALQHLDVKPANLLLVSGHVKIADFGLLKDLQDCGASLVNGLTPRYASPEVFDGHPTQFSDQYSLAIVFQEMLTGRLPFDGVSAAQLASQHVHGLADLSMLSPPDRFSVGKALAKDADRRFTDCREFAQRLNHRSSSSIINVPVADPMSSPSAAEKHVSSNPVGVNAGWPMLHDGHTCVITEPDVERLAGPAIDWSSVSYRPTIFVGLGGLAGQVCCQLRQRIKDHLAQDAAVPAIGFLYLDTDIDSINHAVRGDWKAALRQDEVLLLPLRKTQEYRTRPTINASSLSRRWFYNMPRSLRTEGLRALGRIAMLDHAQRVLDHLRRTITKATDGQSLAVTQQCTGLNFTSYDPQVFVVASISGGTGSGMLIDVGYAVRQVLTELGLNDDNVYSVLPLANPFGAEQRQMATANVYACLDELQHFSAAANGYPGETACGLAGFRESSSAFHTNYVVDYRTDRANKQCADMIAQTADYLFLSSMSPAQNFFQACRKEESGDAPPEGFTLRTFGVSQLGADATDFPPQWVDFLCEAVVRKWQGGIESVADRDRIKLSDVEHIFDKPARANLVSLHLDQRAQQKCHDFGLQTANLQDSVTQIATEALGGDIETYFDKLVDDNLNRFGTDQTPFDMLFESMQMIDVVVGTDDPAETGDATPAIETLKDVVALGVRTLGSELGQEVKQWVLELVNCASTRVNGARQTIVQLKDHLRTLREQAATGVKSADSEVALFRDMTEARRDEEFDCHHELEQVLALSSDYAQRAVRRVTACATEVLISVIEAYVSQAADHLRDYWSDLNKLAEQFSLVALRGDEPVTEALDELNSHPMSHLLLEHKMAMIEQIDRELEKTFFGSENSLIQSLGRNREACNRLIAAMRGSAHKTLVATQKKAVREQLMTGPEGAEDEAFREALKESYEAAQPNMLRVGGATRTLLMIPENFDRSEIAEETRQLDGVPPTTVPSSTEDLWVVCEGEQLSVDGVFGTLLRRSPDCQQLAARLHTRIDIDW